ncbi:MAG: hypothetical protein IKO74_03970 [Selenomonadaceae bacterium]|nr:hypothetical protein [Selenomonadaceae bacterium]
MATMINNNVGSFGSQPMFGQSKAAFQRGIGQRTAMTGITGDALGSMSILNQNRIAAQREMQRASKTTQTDDDAINNVSAYTIEESLRIRTQVLDQANKNIQDDTALLKTAQGSGNSIVDSIKEIQRLATSATDEALTDVDRRVIQRDINRLVNQISTDSQITFNGRKLIDGSSTTGNPAIATVMSNNSLYNGTTASTALTALQNSSGVSLGIETSDRITASYVQGGNIYTASFTVGENTLEDIFKNLNRINGVTATEDGGMTYTNAAFVGGERGMLKAPELPQNPEEIRPAEPLVARPVEVIQKPEPVEDPGAEVSINPIPSEYVQADFEQPSNAQALSAYEDLEDAVNDFGDNLLAEDLPEGIGEFVSSLQVEMLASQSDGSVKDLTDWTASDAYKNLSEEARAGADANAGIINNALNNSDYADKLAAYNDKNNEYNAAARQYEIYSTAYEAFLSGAEIIAAPTELDEDATPEQQAQYQAEKEAYDRAVANYSPQEATAYVRYREQKAAFDNYKIQQAEYDQYVSDKAQWDKFDAENKIYLDYKNEYDTELYPQYQRDLAQYNLLTADIVQSDGNNGLSVTARKPGLAEQISGISINVTDASGNTKSAATGALNNFKTTTFAEDEREDNSIFFQIGETIDQTMNFGFNDMRAEAFGLKGADGNIISISTKEDADAALSTINNALSKATEQLQTIGSSEKRLGYIADSLAIEISNIQEPDSMIRNANMAKTLTVYALDFFQRDRMQSMFAIANQHSSAVLGLLR